MRFTPEYMEEEAWGAAPTSVYELRGGPRLICCRSWVVFHPPALRVGDSGRFHQTLNADPSEATTAWELGLCHQIQVAQKKLRSRSTGSQLCNPRGPVKCRGPVTQHQGVKCRSQFP